LHSAKLIGFIALFHLEKSQQLTTFEYNKELERLAIDLSWKSSQIEGNTYSLLETERLLKEKKTASGKPKDDATMLLNHKEAIDSIIDQSDYVAPLRVRAIEDIHNILMKDSGVYKPRYDSIRCAFSEGEALYHGSNFSSRLHIQVCLLNNDLIKGYFLPRPVVTHNPYLLKNFKETT
jgi:Fic family protein